MNHCAANEVLLRFIDNSSGFVDFSFDSKEVVSKIWRPDFYVYDNIDTKVCA